MVWYLDKHRDNLAFTLVLMFISWSNVAQQLRARNYFFSHFV